jgi:hypothetical protein
LRAGISGKRASSGHVEGVQMTAFEAMRTTGRSNLEQFKLLEARFLVDDLVRLISARAPSWSSGTTPGSSAPRRYIPPPPPPPFPPPCSGLISLFPGELGAVGASAWPMAPWAHPARANKTKSAPSRLCKLITPPNCPDRERHLRSAYQHAEQKCSHCCIEGPVCEVEAGHVHLSQLNAEADGIRGRFGDSLAQTLVQSRSRRPCLIQRRLPEEGDVRLRNAPDCPKPISRVDLRLLSAAWRGVGLR